MMDQVNIWGCPDYTYEGKLVILPVNTNVNGTLYIATQYWMATATPSTDVMKKYGDAIWQNDGAKYHTLLP